MSKSHAVAQAEGKRVRRTSGTGSDFSEAAQKRPSEVVQRGARQAARARVSQCFCSPSSQAGFTYSPAMAANAKPISVVTGGAGFLGSHLTDRLLAEGHKVIAIDNLITGNLANIEHLAGNEDYRFVKHNVSELHLPAGEKLDYVFHFASPASPIDYLELPIPTLKVGALGTHNALGLAKAKGAAFLLASTSRVLRRSARPSAEGRLLGQREPDRAARRLR